MPVSQAQKEASKRWTAKNRDKINAIQKEYYLRNRDLVNDKNKIRNKNTYAKKKEEKRVAIQVEADIRANTIANIPIEIFAGLLVGLNLTPEMIAGFHADMVAGVKMGLSANKLAKTHAILITQ